MIINTLDFGTLPVRVNFTDGEFLTQVEMSDGEIYDILKDTTTQQPYAVKGE